MKARFELQGLHEPILVVTPETDDERILFAAFIRYDANLFRVSIDRYENGQIERVRIMADQS